MWETIAEFHAAVNDLPAALFIAALAFDIAGFVTKRESLHSAAFWTLLVAAGGAVVAVVSGLRAEGVIDHGAVMHRSMMRHRNLAIGFTVFAVGLSGWRIFRRGGLPGREVKPYLAVSVIGALALVWASKIGGQLVFQHAGGIQTSVLEAVVVERQAGHSHTSDVEHTHDEAEAPASGDEPDTTDAGHDADHTH